MENNSTATTNDPGTISVILESKTIGDLLVWHILSVACCVVLIIRKWKNIIKYPNKMKISILEHNW